MESIAVIELGGALVVGTALTLGGLILEFIAAQQLTAGAMIQGAWLIALGGIVAIAGITLLRRQVFGSIRGA